MIKVNSTDLSQALGFLYQGYKNGPIETILQNVKLSLVGEVLTMTQVNEDQELTYSISATGDACEFTVEMKKLRDRVGQYDKDKVVSISVDSSSSKAVIKCEKSKVTLKAMPSEYFPDSRSNLSFNDVTVSGSDLKRAIGVVSRSQGNGDVRYYLNSTSFHFSGGICDVVATDGHRLHHCVIPVDSPIEKTCLVPRDSMTPISKFLDSGDITVRVSENHIKISDSESSIQTKLIDGKYPDWRRVIPKNNDIKATFNRIELASALKGVLIVSSSKIVGLVMSIRSGEAKIYLDPKGGVESEEIVNCACQSDIEIGFNGLYLIDSIAAIESENVDIILKDGNSSVLIKDGNYQAVVMPMKI